jgi:hypothetical protein
MPKGEKKMRGRLTKLLEEGHKQYLYYDQIADYLLTNGMVVPPCKVGDTVYYLTNVDTEKELNVTEIFCGVVQGISFDGTDIWIFATYTNGLLYYHKANEFGKTVFPTREEAERVLAERRSSNDS